MTADTMQESSRAISRMTAQEIIRQLGGGQFAAMTGARNFVALESGLQFSIGSGAKDGINKVLIVLEPNDTYTVSFWQCGRGVKGYALRVSEHTDIYCDVLQDLFERCTGFYTTLHARG